MEERLKPHVQRQAQASRLRIDKDDKKSAKKQPELTHTLVTIAPDGGWGWVILAVSTWDCLCLDGTSLAYSVIQKQVSQYLSISDTQSALFVSIFNCVVYLLGPVAAAIANRFGFKMLNIVGGAIGAAALAGCAYGYSFILVLTLYSIITGVGGALMYMVSMAAPGYWFDKRRSLAFGLSNSASGIACVTIPPLCQLLAQQNWHMVYFFTSAMYAVAFLGGFLIRKPPMMLVEVDGYQPARPDKPAPVSMSMSILNVRGGGGTNKNVEEKMKQMSFHAVQAQQKGGVSPTSSKLSEASIVLEREPESRWEKASPCCSKQEIQLERPLYKSDIFLTSRVDLPKEKNEAEQLLKSHKMTTAEDIKQQLGKEYHCCPEAIMRPLKEMVSLPLLKNFVFLIFLLSTMTYFSAIYVTYLYVPRTSERKGFSEATGIKVLQCFGGCMFVSRISLGIIFHLWPELPPHYFTSIYMTLGGICHICLALTKHEVVLYVFGSAMGFLSGVWVPMRSVLIVRYIGLDQLTNAMGMLFVFQAFGSLLGAPVAQALSAAFNEEYVTYYFAGGMFALTGVLALPLECLNDCMKRRKKRSSAHAHHGHDSHRATTYDDPT